MPIEITKSIEIRHILKKLYFKNHVETFSTTNTTAHEMNELRVTVLYKALIINNINNMKFHVTNIIIIIMQ